MRALLITAALAGCVSPVMSFGGGKTATQAQHDTMAEFGPARLASGETWKGEVTKKKIRVWADNQYRTQNRQWQHAFDEPLELANIVIKPLLGLELVADYQIWERHVPGSTLADDLEALEERDPGTDVFAVVGLTSSLPLLSATFDQLGLATLGGKHMMIRGYNDLEERKAYANAFPDLRAEEREMALVQLRQHKTAVVLLHELGHLLGADHETDSDTIMNASYSNHASRFSAAAKKTMLSEVDRRLQRGGTTPAPVQPPPDRPRLDPKPAKPPPPGVTVHHDPITIRVTRQGATIVDGKSLDAKALDALLTPIFAEDPTTKLVISEDKKVPVGVTGDLIDHLKTIGFTKFELAWSGK